MRTPQALVNKDLPSTGYHDRLTKALSEWLQQRRMAGLAGAQAMLLKNLQDAFGDDAPKKATISLWLRRKALPGVDNTFMLATVLGVRPAWLAFEDGGTGFESDSDALEAFHAEQERKYPPRPQAEAPPRKGRRAG